MSDTTKSKFRTMNIKQKDYDDLCLIRDYGDYGTLANTIRVVLAHYRVSAAQRGNPVVVNGVPQKIKTK
jgi:hypothetical protein